MSHRPGGAGRPSDGRELLAVAELGRRPHQSVRPLLPTSTRRPAALVLGGAVLALAAGALCVHDKYADPLDRRVGSWVAGRLGGHGRSLQLVADLGQKVQVIVIVAAMIAACVAVRRVNGAVFAAASTPAAAIATEKVLKPLAGHLYSYASYPSGHATSIFALVATAAVLLAGPPARIRPALRIVIVAVAVLIGCAVSVAVIGLGDHHLIDTIGGAAVGIAVVLAAAFLLDLPVSQRLLGPAQADAHQRQLGPSGGRRARLAR